MQTIDQSRLADARATPRVMQLWWALRPLKSVMRFMQSGAHPDDEDSGMLAALIFRDGINLSYACSTRGEGGQNDIGTEAGAELGALRTREMERACDILDMRMYWHSERWDDPITDFGFSKTGTETFSYWGHDRTLARFVEIIRTDRPDILCPTFLDVPGQHGHHRAMTQAAHEVMAAAADPAYPSNLPPWQVKNLYLPAWSGAGQTYDDDVPPPPATLTIDSSGGDPMSGWVWDRIGQMSRSFHRTQGMGVWVGLRNERDWPLHLAESHVSGPDSSLFSGIPNSVADLAQLAGARPISNQLDNASKLIDAAIAAFPDFQTVADNALKARAEIEHVIYACPDNLRGDIIHRLVAKRDQLDRVVRISLGIIVQASTDNSFLSPGTSTSVRIDIDKGSADTLSVQPVLPSGWSIDAETLSIDSAALPSDPYRAAYDPAAPTTPYWSLGLNVLGHDLSIATRFGEEPFVLPAPSASVTPSAILINLENAARDTELQIMSADAISLSTPDGWTTSTSDDAVTISAPTDLTPSLYELSLFGGDKPAQSTTLIDYPHITPTAQFKPAVVKARALHAIVPDVRVGYVGAGNDRVGHWISTLGAQVEDVSDTDLLSDAALQRFDTIIVGIFAYKFRTGLLEAAPKLNNWCRNGGTLVTLYHRPWDNWDADTTPPLHLDIGEPSLRWRVTDENSAVTHLADHPILTSPNRITEDDWSGWVKERGLYFAKSWDKAYVPLLAINDPGEAPLHGSLLAADVGKGRHVHTSLILHHQMEHLVPGAFRLMANIIARRE